MSLIRRRIAERLVAAQQNGGAAHDVQRNRHVGGDAVAGEVRRNVPRAAYGVKLGFMSFFVKAVIDALKAFPAINAEVRGTDIIYRNYFHIGVAVSTDRGLVLHLAAFCVPLIRGSLNADKNLLRTRLSP